MVRSRLLLVGCMLMLYPVVFAQDSIKIMPFGDSICEGDWIAGWRNPLRKMLADSAYVFDFVGRCKTNHSDHIYPSYLFPEAYWDHEGVGARAIFQWLPCATTALNENPPKIMIIELGTNDIANGTRTTVQMCSDMSALLDTIWKFDPTIYVVLSTTLRAYAENVPLDSVINYNALLPAMVESKAAEGKYIVLVDCFNALDSEDDFIDGVHPGHYPEDGLSGYEKMAQVFYPAVAHAIDFYTAMPVQMTSFNALLHSTDVVELLWSTATETNNYGFEVARRAVKSEHSAIKNWEKVGFIAGNGTTNVPHAYTYRDSPPEPGRYLYRLKQIDNDGTFEYSKSVEVIAAELPRLFTVLQNYPNPFNPATTIGFTLQEDGFTTLKVYDMLGREVATLVNENRSAGILHQVVFQASHLSSGIYYYRVQSGAQVQMNKLLLMK